jgi:hypothetical protein
MGSDFLDYTLTTSPKRAKQVFTAFVELMQNIAEYYDQTFSEDSTPDAFINLKIRPEVVIIHTANEVLEKDLKNIKTTLGRFFSLDEIGLENERKEALLKGKSLGMIMIRKMLNKKFEWGLQTHQNKHWLTFDLRLEL